MYLILKKSKKNQAYFQSFTNAILKIMHLLLNQLRVKTNHINVYLKNINYSVYQAF